MIYDKFLLFKPKERVNFITQSDLASLALIWHHELDFEFPEEAE